MRNGECEVRNEGARRSPLRHVLPVLCAGALSVALGGPPSAAEIRVIRAEYAYAQGAQDSTADARRIAAQEAKRAALEQAGSFAAGLPPVKEYRLTADELTAYLAGIMESGVVTEETRGSARRPVIAITVTGTIDTDLLAREIVRYRESEELRALLETSTRAKAALRKERNDLLIRLADEQDRAKVEGLQRDLDALLDREEAVDAVNRVWARTVPRLDLYGGREVNGDVRLDDLAGSIAALEQAIALNPRDQQARILLAALSAQQKDLTGAERELRSALAQEPDNLLLHLRLGIVLRERGRPQDGLKEFRVVEKKRPNQPPLLFQISLAHKAAGNCRLASGYARRFLQYTKRNDRPDIAKMKPQAQAIVKACGDLPPPQTKGDHP